jgi:hypothetical protein
VYNTIIEGTYQPRTGNDRPALEREGEKHNAASNRNQNQPHDNEASPVREQFAEEHAEPDGGDLHST